MGFFWPRPRYPQAEGPRVKLRQNGIVSLMIRPAVFLAGGRAYMKLHQVKSEPQRRRITNIECRRVGSLRSVIFVK